MNRLGRGLTWLGMIIAGLCLALMIYGLIRLSC